MDKYIDMHCHILPEVDDGACDIEEMVSMLRVAYDEGIRSIIATPHYHPRRGHERPGELRKKLKLVRQEASSIDDKFRIYLGMEVYFGQDVPEQLAKGRLLSMNNRGMVLVEFSPSDSFSYIQQGIQQIQLAGYEVILAHAERYQCLLERIESVEHLWEMGINIQVNAGSIVGKSGMKAKWFVKKLMAHDLVFGVGTDAHNSDNRAPKMKKAAEYVKKRYGEDYMRRIFFDNAHSLLKKVK